MAVYAGGIRCDVYSAHLRDKGFNSLYTLEGGVQNYLRQEGHDMWDGSLFVFDGRMAVPSGQTCVANFVFVILGLQNRESLLQYVLLVSGL